MRRRDMLLAAPVLASQAAAQVGWPDRTIRLVVPFPPGGPTDLVARPLVQRLAEALGRPIQVDNRGGAGGNVGADQVAKAAPDGHMLLLSNVGVLAINPSLYRSMPFDATRDFAPIATIAAAPVALVVQDSVPARNVAEFVAWARQGAQPYGTAGAGSPGHLAGAMFRALTGVQLTHVPYRGSAPAIQDLVGGYLLVMFDPVQALLPQIEAGRVRCLALSSPARSAALPDVPTMAEAGVVGHEMTAWWALVAPAGTPAPVIGRLTRETTTILREPEFIHGLARQGISILQIDSDALSRFLAEEAEKWGRAVRESGASVD
jgi:tripartite-type tricarboxylate transporter receptor subunit TctC